jgi:hypothetical protein
MPNFTTIITPLRPDEVDSCRQYLRTNAEPSADFARDRLQCQPLFPFDRIPTLHFCSFVILEAEADFGPSLVFEATFDGPRADFLDALLRVAPQGLHEVYRRCEGYPASAMAAPQLIREYFESHDVGANTYFSGAPGRTVAQIKDENAIHSGIVKFLSQRWRAGDTLPARLTGIFDAVREDFIRGRAQHRWADAPAKLPWEVTSRSAVAIVAGVAVLLVACAIGAVVDALLPRFGIWTLYHSISHGLEAAGMPASGFIHGLGEVFPWMKSFIEALRPALPLLAGGTVIWLAIRAGELLLTNLTRNPRDHSFWLRIPLQIAVILRYAMMAFLIGSVVLIVILGMEPQPGHDTTTGWNVGGLLLALLITAVVLALLQYFANSLRLTVALKPFKTKEERWRRLGLDLIQYAMLLTFAVGLLAVARHTPLTIDKSWADALRSVLAFLFVLLAYGLLGVLVGYAVGVLLFVAIRTMERSDKKTFADPDALLQRAAINARKYAREEGGINTYQNHLASLTYVKPGAARRWLLWLALFAVNLLARFWFNRGELGGIPTILSARWVMIDNGRRLLFLDNFGGAWESYLNEFIDLTAVKGLNAIWSSTFVHAVGKRFGFPATQFFFWQGAQAEQPFKAYVRESQIETLVWYGAYPMLSVINVNANTDLRQALSAPLTAPQVDAVFQNL